MTSPKETAAPLPRVWVNEDHLTVFTDDDIDLDDPPPGITAYYPEAIVERRVKEARAEERAEALGEAVDLIKERSAQGVLLRSTLDELDEMSDAARSPSGAAVVARGEQDE